MTPRRLLSLFVAFVIVLMGAAALVAGPPASAADPCAAPVTNPVACENTKPGDPASDWQVDGVGDSTIQGFATSMSVNAGQTVNFKIKTPASSYHIDILRLGYYQGNGARLIASNILPTAKLPQTQPNCLTDSTTGLVDCGNWGVSASWAVPSDAVSGLYIAHLVRNDTGGESQIFFVVRNDASHSDVVLQTSDATWEAYNAYGGNSLYSCTVACPPGNPLAYKAAYAVSYNRPFDGTLSTDSGMSDPFYSEYQLIRWLERNGYNLSYTSEADVDANGPLLQNHKVFISSGHDEYWSKGQRQNVEAARDAGVNLAFFSGNEVFWKTRWGNSIDGSSTPYRTLTTYKETHFDAKVDPLANVWTGTWRDPRFSPPADGGRPENSLTGQYFIVNSGTSDIKVPGTMAKLRFWRNTPVANLTSSQTLTLAPGVGTLGYEWDEDPDNGFRPAGRIPLSSTTVSGLETFTDYGSLVAENTSATHSLSLYRAPSGALVFGSGTVQWSWGLDNTNAWGNSTTRPSSNPVDPTMQQATANLLADMGAQPATLQSGLVAPTPSTDTTPPMATVTSPTAGASIADGTSTTISGTASDSGGVVAGVEVSTDGGSTWHKATGTTSWTYTWIAHGEPSTAIEARAIDDSANIGAPSTGVTVTVTCPCSIFGSEVPAVPDEKDGSATNLGMKFRSDVGGTVTGVRFYKSTANTGTHIGSLYTASGTLLAQATFTGETASGWQQVLFSTPVAIQPNTTYVVAYYAPKGHYAGVSWGFNNPPPLAGKDFDAAPLHGLLDPGNGNGLYTYQSSAAFPTSTYQAENYYVDVMFTPSTTPPGAVSGVSATAGTQSATVSWSAPSTGGAPTTYKVTPYIGSTAQTATTVTGAPPATTATVTGLTAGTSYTFTVTPTNAAGSGPESSKSNAVTPTAPTAPGVPTGVSATAGLQSATVSWTAPSSNGGSPITGYQVIPYIGTTAQTPVSAGASATSATLSGLTAGTAYTFTVQAINAVGPSPESSPSGSVTPTAPTAPGAPTGVSATAGVQSATVSWTAPSSNGGSPITGYQVIPYIGGLAQTPVSAGASATSATLNGLTGGTTYTFTVQAINAVGPSAESAPSNAVTPATAPTAPGAPTAVSAVAGLNAATVSWTPPSSNGGSAITGYKVIPYIGTTAGTPVSAASTATSVTVSGLTGGTTYTFTVVATNAVGSSAESSPSNAVTVLSATVPGAPTGVTATARSAAAVVTWTAPASNGNSAITGYVITPYVGSSAHASTTAGASATSATVSGLTNGVTYTFAVAAVNAVGTGPQSTASSAVTPRATIFDLATPATVDSGDTSSVELGVKFQSDVAGTINGIRFYKAAANTGTHIGSLWTSSGTLLASATFSGETASGWQQVLFSSPVSISANTTYVAGYLAPKGHYSVTQPGFSSSVDNAPLHALANATSVNGVYAYSSSSTFPSSSYQASNYFADVLFTPAAASAPGAVSGVTATAGMGSATVSWTAPSTGSAPTTYKVTPYIGSTAQTATTITGTPPATTATISGLTGGTSYTFTVTASNSAGSGPESSQSNAVTPTSSTTPGAPTGVSAAARETSAIVTWAAPVSDGGSAITGYRITPYIGSAAQTATTVGASSTSATVSGLTDGTTYTFTVTAVNANGPGTESAASAAAMPRLTIFEQGVPAIPDVADTSSVVLGVEFTSDNAGKIAGIRFYKAATNTGTHIVSLWDTSGTLLASATASGETASGWQEVRFSSPVSISANTTYVASYFAPNGHYSATGQGFASATDSPPLHAVANATSANGVYAYSPSNTYPFSTYNATNYWVDVMYTP